MKNSFITNVSPFLSEGESEDIISELLSLPWNYTIDKEKLHHIYVLCTLSINTSHSCFTINHLALEEYEVPCSNESFLLFRYRDRIIDKIRKELPEDIRDTISDIILLNRHQERTMDIYRRLLI